VDVAVPRWPAMQAGTMRWRFGPNTAHRAEPTLSHGAYLPISVERGDREKKTGYLSPALLSRVDIVFSSVRTWWHVSAARSLPVVSSRAHKGTCIAGSRS
jgi:hypothetical protein